MDSLDVYVSADLEGIAGWVGDDESDPRTRAAMVGDVNAVVEGILEAAPEATVTVADSHGDKQTIPPADLHERASLLRGDTRPYGMVDGADGADLACLVGYHARPGSGGYLEHTFTGSIAGVRLDGTPVGELELNAGLLAAWNVPVGLVTGDDRLAETVADCLPGAEYVTTKTARSATAAVCRPETTVRDEIRAAATTVAADPPGRASAPVDTDPTITVEVGYVRADFADLATLWPGVDAAGDSRTVTYQAGDVPQAYQFVRAATTVRPGD